MSVTAFNISLTINLKKFFLYRFLAPNYSIRSSIPRNFVKEFSWTFITMWYKKLAQASCTRFSSVCQRYYGDFWIRNWFHIATHLVVVLLLVVRPSPINPRLRRSKVDRDEIWQDCFSSKYRPTHRLTKCDIWCDVLRRSRRLPCICHSVCRLPANSSSACKGSSWSIVHLYLLIFLVMRECILQ